MGTILLNPFEIFAEGVGDQAAIFTGTNFGDLVKQSVYEIQDFEHEVILTKSVTAFLNVVQIQMHTTSAFGSGLIFFTSNRLNFSYGSNQFKQFNFVFSNSVPYKINVKRFDGDLYLYVNDSLEQAVSFTTALTYNLATARTKIATRFGDTQKFTGTIQTYKYFELNSSGDRINEFINLDINNGNTNTIPNIGADAPSTPDMTWNPAGSGTYEDL